MENILDLWKELQNHPDFVTGRIHTKQSVIESLEEHLDDEDFNRVSELFVNENKFKIADVIDSFETDNYQYCSWIDNMENLIEEGTQKIFSYDSEIS
jgi:hypothetical protein